MIELLGLLMSWATRAVTLDNAFDRVYHAGLLYKLHSYGISDQIFGLVLSFLSHRQLFKWFWMVSLPKNTQLILEFLTASFLVPHFSKYTLMTFLMMLSVILLSMLMRLLSTLSNIRNPSCANNYNWLLNLNMI